MFGYFCEHEIHTLKTNPPTLGQNSDRGLKAVVTLWGFFSLVINVMFQLLHCIKIHFHTFYTVWYMPTVQSKALANTVVLQPKFNCIWMFIQSSHTKYVLLLFYHAFYKWISGGGDRKNRVGFPPPLFTLHLVPCKFLHNVVSSTYGMHCEQTINQLWWQLWTATLL